jgi:hypothetical protein
MAFRINKKNILIICHLLILDNNSYIYKKLKIYLIVMFLSIFLSKNNNKFQIFKIRFRMVISDNNYWIFLFIDKYISFLLFYFALKYQLYLCVLLILRVY